MAQESSTGCYQKPELIHIDDPAFDETGPGQWVIGNKGGIHNGGYGGGHGGSPGGGHGGGPGGGHGGGPGGGHGGGPGGGRR